MASKVDNWMLPLAVHTLDGEIRWAEAPTTEEFLKHAERYGIHMVAETAAQYGFDLERLATLIQQLDVIDQKHHQEKRAFTFGRRWTKPKQSADVRAKKLLPDEEEEVAA